MRFVVVASLLTISMLTLFFYRHLQNVSSESHSEDVLEQALKQKQQDPIQIMPATKQVISDISPSKSAPIISEPAMSQEKQSAKNNAKLGQQSQESTVFEQNEAANNENPKPSTLADLRPDAGQLQLDLHIDSAKSNSDCDKNPCRPMGRDGVLITGLQWQLGASSMAAIHEIAVGRWEDNSPLVHHRSK